MARAAAAAARSAGAATARSAGAATARSAGAPARAPVRPRPASPRPASPPRRRSGRAQPSQQTQPLPRLHARRRAALAVGRFVEARTQGLIDRLLRGRLWVGFVGALLAGIVFLNVSLLQLNQEIARTSVHASALDRQNSSLRARLSALDSSERIQRLAALHGMTMPAPGQYRYLEARPWLDSELAARRAVPPAIGGAGLATAASATPAPTATAAAPVAAASAANPVTSAGATASATTASASTAPAANSGP